MDALTDNPSAGAKLVARAWLNKDFKELLLKDPKVAAATLGVSLEGTNLVVLENTDTVHNIVVCTLCSCYPKKLLGRPPDWYKSRSYRARTVIDPRGVLEEFGIILPEHVTVKTHDSTADMRYLVLPKPPPGYDKLSEDELKNCITRDAMVGVRLVEIKQQ